MNALRTIGDQVQHEHRLRILPFGVISRVRSLKLNCKPQKNKRSSRATIKQKGLVQSNLINVKNLSIRKQGNITIGTCNVQSLQNKELQINELISDYSLDLLVLTETWLMSNHQFWKDTTTLNRDNLKLHTLDRSQGRGGGLALVTKRHLQVSQLRTSRPSFEATWWRVKCRNTEITIHGIYHPPYSLTNKTTNAMFIDEFCDYVSTHLPDNPNNIFIGDFNLHVSDDQDTDSAIFNDSIDAVGLYQHVQFQTHWSGNILDLLLSDITQSTGLLTVAPGPYISDH